MTTFVLKKYNQEKNINEPNPTEEKKEEAPEELTITVTGTISEIVANALNKAFASKVDIEEVAEDDRDADIKAVSTENINTDPLVTFESIHKGDIVFIHNQGFKTAAEEWFLTNIPNKTSNVFYTIESFIKFVKNKFKID